MKYFEAVSLAEHLRGVVAQARTGTGKTAAFALPMVQILTSDTGGGLDGHGLILEHPEARIARFAEEHGFLDLTRSNTRPNVGDVVRIVPNHVCVVVNMMDEVVMVRGDEIIGTLPVAARGKLR